MHLGHFCESLTNRYSPSTPLHPSTAPRAALSVVWNHDPDRLRDAVDYCGRGRGVWKPRFHVLAVPGPSGYLFNLAALDERTPCHPGARQAPGESTSDFLVRAMREDHGFTVPGRSFLAPDVVEGQE
jgi:hypothetical protein